MTTFAAGRGGMIRAKASAVTPDGLGHTRKVSLTTVQAQISGTHTSFPALFTLANLPSEMFDADGASPAQNGGGDIRFSSDSAGTSLLPAEVASFVTNNNPALGYAEIWVKLPNVRSTQTDQIWCWYNTLGTPSQPAVGAANGRNAVWSDYVMVSHDLSVDATGSFTLTPTGTVTTGRVNPFGRSGGARGFGTTLGAATTDRVTTNLTAHNTQRTYSLWANRNGNGGGGAGRIFDKRTSGAQVELIFFNSVGSLMQFDRTWSGGALSWSTAALGTGVWTLETVTYDASAGTNDPVFYRAGTALSSTDTSTTGTVTNNAEAYIIGNRSNDNLRNWDGLMCEFKIFNGIKSAAWNLTEFNNHNAPVTFITVGTPQGA